nr:substrate-binding domain-containing protein [Micromonospora sp. DSM 115978]
MSEVERNPSDDRSARRPLANALLAAVGAAIGVLLEGWPDGPTGWLTVAIAGAIGALLSLALVADALAAVVGWLMRRLRPIRPVLVRRSLLVGLALALFTVFGRSLVGVAGDTVEWADIRLTGCPAPTELRLLTTAEGLTTAERLADTYTLATARSRQDCPTVRIHVFAAPPLAAGDALRSGWQANSLRTLGPRPDVWLPGASRHALVGTAESSNGLLTAAPTRSLATTPLVLALPASELPAVFASARAGLTWTEALAALERLGWGLARPDPASSVTGEYATLAMYASGGDPVQLTTASAEPELVDPARARAIEGLVADTLDRADYPLAGDALDLLCHHRQRGSAPVALAITEQQMIQFNAGLALGGCGAGPAATPDRSLVAVYPTDTVALDQPMVTLDWADRSPAQATQIAGFRQWLASDAGKQALLEVGLRPPDRAAGEPVSERLGALPGVAYLRMGLTDRALKAARDQWRAVRRPGRVLLLLDASGSMRTPAGTAGLTRFDVAVRGVTALAGRVSDPDEFGVWVFQGPRRQPERLVPVGRLTGAGKDLVGARLAEVRPGGDTPLYRAVVAGVAAVGPGEQERVTALVVLTDGADDGSGLREAEVLSAVGGAGVRIFVVAIGATGCTGAVQRIADDTGGVCDGADLVGLDRQLGTLFDALWGGTGG